MLKSSRAQQAGHNLSSRLLRHVACLATALFVVAGCGGGSDLPATQLSSVQSSPSVAGTTSLASTTPVTSAETVAPVEAAAGQSRTSVSPAPVMAAVSNGQGAGLVSTTTPPVPLPASAAPASADPLPAPAAPAVAKLIAFYGDSTMRGAETFNVSTLAPVTAPQAMIADLPSGAYAARNEGVNSSHTDELLAGSDGVHAAWDAEMANSKADIVVINHGSQFQPAIGTYKANLHTLTMTARAAGKFVIFQTPSPTQNGRAGMDPVVDAMKQQAAADNVPVIDVYEYLYSYMKSHGQTEYDLVPDGYHPSDSAYVLIGKYAASVFKTIVH